MQASTLHAAREEYHEIKAGLGEHLTGELWRWGQPRRLPPVVTILVQSGATAPDTRLPLFPGPPRQPC
jgi:hypothetical protein